MFLRKSVPGSQSSFSGPVEEVRACGIAGTGICRFVTAAGSAVPRCECISSQASCQAEAASRPGASVSESCPPGLTPEPTVCAVEGQNCRPSYLEQNGIEGCCEGLLCRDNAGGVPVCTTGSPEDVELYRQCRSGGPPLEVLDPLPIPGGAVQFDNVEFAFSTSGPRGCLSEVELYLNKSSISSLCSMTFSAGPAADAKGLLVNDFTLFNDNCPEWTLGQAWLTQDSIEKRVRFVGLSCEIQDNNFCFMGTFELLLTGELELVSRERVPLTGAPLRIRGQVCSGPQSSQCPMP